MKFRIGINKIVFLLLVVALLFTHVNVFPISASPEGSDPPIHIHLTWGQNDTAHTIVVTWKTSTENAGDNVWYDTVPHGGDPALYENSPTGKLATGSYHSYIGPGRYVHDVELTGLAPDTVYYFICGGENGGYSEERSFRTAPDTSTSFTFVAGGDSRSGDPGWPEERDSISRKIAEFNPSFVLFTGDFIDVATDQDEWDNWFAAMQMYWVDNNNRTIPIIPSVGNHEVSGYTETSKASALNYYEQFYLPENERWYSLDWGPDLHIIVLNSQAEMDGEQLEWLENDLMAHQSSKWKVAIFHRPPFSSSTRGSSQDARTYWVPLFDQYHVDLVFCGHDHFYERTGPINYTRSQDQLQSSSNDGTIYVTSGGWGAPLYNPGKEHWWTEHLSKQYHFIVVTVAGNSLHLEAVNVDGQIFDEVSLPYETGGFDLMIILAIVIVVIVCVIVVGYYIKKSKNTSG